MNQNCLKCYAAKPHQTQKIRWNLELTPHPHLFQEELNHWVDMTENAWLILGQLFIKAGWWDVPSLSGILAETVLIYLLNNTNLLLLFAHNHSTKVYGPFSFIFLLYTTIRPKVRVLIELFLLCAHDHSAEIYAHGPLSFILSFVHDHSTKT